MIVTSFYAGILVLMFVGLSVRVVLRRTAARVTLGDGGDRALLRRLRVHGNFAEYVPFALILMALAEAQGLAVEGLHAIGAVLILGRCLHAFGVSREPEPIRWRVVGMALTFTALLGAAAANLAMTLMIWFYAA